jgi:hypothetical protein
VGDKRIFTGLTEFQWDQSAFARSNGVRGDVIEMVQGISAFFDVPKDTAHDVKRRKFIGSGIDHGDIKGSPHRHGERVQDIAVGHTVKDHIVRLRVQHIL